MMNVKKQNKENSNRIRIDILLTLCEIIDDYDDYINDMNNLIEKYGSNVSYNLFRIIQGEFVLFSDRYKNFISRYQNVIDTMKKYDTTWYFTGSLDCNFKGVSRKTKIDIYYDYLVDNRENIEFIKYNINKLNNLGFHHITLVEDENFDNQVYALDFNNDNLIVLLDNMEFVSTCDNDEVFYTGKDSEYKITVRRDYDDLENDSKKSIELNTLLFNPDRIPTDLSYTTALNKIKNLDPTYSIIQNYIKFSSITNLLTSEVETLNETLNDMIGGTTSKKKMIELLTTINNSVDLLKKESEKYEEDVINNSYLIGKEKLEKEKNKVFSKISLKNN